MTSKKLLRKRAGPQNQITNVVLSCNHIMVYPRPFPRTHDITWCQRCDDYRMVLPRNLHRSRNLRVR